MLHQYEWKNWKQRTDLNIKYSLYIPSVMINIVNLADDNKYSVEEFLMKDPYRNAYIISDINDNNSEIKIVYENNIIRGVLLLYHRSNEIIWFYGNRESCKYAINTINYDSFIMIIDEKNLDIIKLKFKIGYYKEYIMRLKIKDFTFSDAGNIKKLDESNIDQYSNFIKCSGKVVNPEEYIKNFDVFGYFVDNKLVSSGEIVVKTLKTYGLGGIYTLRKYRNMGYARELISYIVKYCSNKTENIILYVRQNNTAVNLYRDLGFKTIGESIFVDYNTGVVP